MKLNHFRCDIDDDGIALLTWDMADRSMNVINLEVVTDLETIGEALTQNDSLKGAVIASGKDRFSGGADLGMLEGLLKEFRVAQRKDAGAAMQTLFDRSRRLSLALRQLEACGKPVVAAINGTALGGAFELALACHHRVCVEDDTARVGLPEVKVGLFPGAGGTQRLPRMIPVAEALPMLLQGEQMRISKAKAVGLVDQVVASDALIATAIQWAKENPGARQPWDVKGYRLPGGNVYSPKGVQTFSAANAIYRRETFDNYPGARAMLQSVYEGLQVNIDVALRIESRYFAQVLRSPQAAAMIRSLFVSMQELNKGARRPQAIPMSKLRKVAVIGAGFMGAGVAYVTAQAGIDVVLLDREIEAAEKGKSYSDKLLTKAVSRGRIDAATRENTLSRIHPTVDYQDVADCDLVIEAVFEDRDIKREVIGKLEAQLGEQAILGSNTSTLPISSLAGYTSDPGRFIGIHFFSPVDKMMLVEIILGEQTNDTALAVALDYCRAIRKTPIVVNDSRGFYTSRVVGTYIREGHLMLADGVPAAMIENVGKMAGMPVGPLSLNDEVAVDLAWKILQATKKDVGAKAVEARQEALLETMVIKLQRYGRKNGKGFYDYSDRGEKKLWPGLGELAERRLDPDEIDVDRLKQRLLVMQALETARCFEEGVLTDVREADVGSILGFGFAPFTGGTLSYVDGMGVNNFVALCKKLTRAHGRRFRPNKLLIEMAERGESFYGRFPPAQKQDHAA